MAFWEIEHEGTRLSAADWGVTVATRKLVNLGADIVNIEFDGLAVSPFGENAIVDYQGNLIIDSGLRSLFESRILYRDTIVIYRNNVRWFTGTVTKTPKYGDARNEGVAYEISGPWWYLENIVFQQAWAEVDTGVNDGSLLAGDPLYRSRVLLGMAEDGQTLITSGAQIQAIIDYAIGAASSPGRGDHKGVWDGTGFTYAVNDIVTYGSAVYRVITSHTSTAS